MFGDQQRLLDRHIDFAFVQETLKASYSHTGRPSIDPEVLLRILLIGYLYGITSERRWSRTSGCILLITGSPAIPGRPRSACHGRPRGSYTPLIILAPGIISARPSAREVALLPVAAIMFAWPGALVGLFFGVPTAYWLFRMRQTGIVAYVLVGVFYTIAPLIAGQALTTSARYLEWVPLFALLGLLNGAIVRMIILGSR